MESATMTTKGQMVIPLAIRRRLKLKPGIRIRFVPQGQDYLIRPVTDEHIERMAGVLGTKGRALQALMEEKKRERKL